MASNAGFCGSGWRWWTNGARIRITSSWMPFRDGSDDEPVPLTAKRSNTRGRLVSCTSSLRRTREGHALPALRAWRRQLGAFLLKHRERYKEMQDAYDDWWDLAPYERERVPQPPRPPSARYIDAGGAPWIIDDRFLALLDDLTKRMQMWRFAERQE